MTIPTPERPDTPSLQTACRCRETAARQLEELTPAASRRPKGPENPTRRMLITFPRRNRGLSKCFVALDRASPGTRKTQSQPPQRIPVTRLGADTGALVTTLK